MLPGAHTHMATLKLKPGVVTGTALQELFAYCKESKCALPAVNVIGSHTANAALQAAREAKAPFERLRSRAGRPESSRQEVSDPARI